MGTSGFPKEILERVPSTMNEKKVLYYLRSEVSDYLRVCDVLLKKSPQAPLTSLEREVILLYTRKLIEAFL
jgi:hypothetical protein